MSFSLPKLHTVNSENTRKTAAAAENPAMPETNDRLRAAAGINAGRKIMK